tara:strand:- start:751 stop:1260 length:510 start_codon:yes stop_codon:yes gene_type:complete
VSDKNMQPINISQIFIGGFLLVVGSLIYIFDRNPDQVWFLYTFDLSHLIGNESRGIFGKIGQNLPAFIHVFSFSLISGGLLPSPSKTNYFIVCLLWALVDISFEFFQSYNKFLFRIIPKWFTGIPFFENIENYFQNGTFDYLDILYIAIGSISAYLVLSVSKKREIRNG